MTALDVCGVTVVVLTTDWLCVDVMMDEMGCLWVNEVTVEEIGEERAVDDIVVENGCVTEVVVLVKGGMELVVVMGEMVVIDFDTVEDGCEIEERVLAVVVFEDINVLEDVVATGSAFEEGTMVAVVVTI